MKKLLLFAVVMAMGFGVLAQTPNEKEKKPATGYQFTIVKELKSTPVKNQNRTGLGQKRRIQGKIIASSARIRFCARQQNE